MTRLIGSDGSPGPSFAVPLVLELASSPHIDGLRMTVANTLISITATLTATGVLNKYGGWENPGFIEFPVIHGCL